MWGEPTEIVTGTDGMILTYESREVREALGYRTVRTQKVTLFLDSMDVLKVFSQESGVTESRLSRQQGLRTESESIISD